MTRGLTLLELMVVVFILAAVATTAASVVSEADDQARYELTSSRLEQLREAILGRAGGRSGFASDMGRLPASVDELLEQGSAPDFAWLGSDPDPRLGAGWRGPYLDRAPGAGDGYADGWGLDATAPDWGWVFSVSSAGGGLLDQLTVTSLGRDGAVGGVQPYEEDRSLRLTRERWQVELSGWSLDAELVNAAGTPFTDDVRLQLEFVSRGGLSQRLSDSIAVNLAAQTSQVTPFLFSVSSLASPDPATEDPAWIPAGRVRVSVVADAPPHARVGTTPAVLLDLQPQGVRPLRLPRPWRVQ